MATAAQINRLGRRLDAMTCLVFECGPGQIPNPVDRRDEERTIERGHRDFSSDSRGWTTWDRLTDSERRAVLGKHIDWHGLTEAQQQLVIQRVLGGGESESWVKGLSDPLRGQGDNILKAIDLIQKAMAGGGNVAGGNDISQDDDDDGCLPMG